jgi:SnoaL-like protein
VRQRARGELTGKEMTPASNERAALSREVAHLPSSGNEFAVRSIIEFANRGEYAKALDYYHPGAQLKLPNGKVAGTHTGHAAIAEMIELAIKIYGRPRVQIVELDVINGKVFAETVSVMTSEAGDGPESHDLHVFEFVEGKVVRHQVFASGRGSAHDAPAD